ncbi:MAG: hypothetical protein ACOY4M_05520 [Pseudomonadota bacterium]
MNTSTIVQKLWNYCNVLRDDGMSYGDYVEAAPAHPCARGIRTSMFSTVVVLAVPPEGRQVGEAAMMRVER